MKKFLGMIALAMIVFVACGKSTKKELTAEIIKAVAIAEKIAEISSGDGYLEKLLTHYAGKGDLGLVKFAASETAKYSLMLGMGERDIINMLAMWHVESRYVSGMTHADGKSFGLTGVRKSNVKKLRGLWRDIHVDLPSIDDPSTQIALGVMAYNETLRQAKGDDFQAIRRYNGGNRGGAAYKRAHAHAMRVIAARKQIFGR